jgi:OOP family OmpA-OmpF porin
MSRIIPLVLVLGICLALAACSSSRRRSRSARPSPPPAASEYTPPAPEVVAEWLYEEAANVPEGHKVHKRIQRVTFPSGSSALNTEGRGALRETVEILKTNPRWHILIAGLADNQGETGNPMQLGDARAKSVRSFLVDQGIEETRISTMALGSKYAEGDKFQPVTVASDRRAELWAFMK